MSSSGTHNSVGSNILSPVAYIMPTTFNPPPTRTQKQNHWSSFINNSLDFASRSAGPQLHLNSMTLYFHPIKEISSEIILLNTTSARIHTFNFGIASQLPIRTRIYNNQLPNTDHYKNIMRTERRHKNERIRGEEQHPLNAKSHSRIVHRFSLHLPILYSTKFTQCDTLLRYFFSQL